jgi:hypothetical protein
MIAADGMQATFPSQRLTADGMLMASPHHTEREARLQEYQRAHANVPIIDPVEHIRPLHDRATMLGALSNGITILVGCTAVSSCVNPENLGRTCTLLACHVASREGKRDTGNRLLLSAAMGQAFEQLRC